jgi:hypothetical protein
MDAATSLADLSTLRVRLRNLLWDAEAAGVYFPAGHDQLEFLDRAIRFVIRKSEPSARLPSTAEDLEPNSLCELCDGQEEGSADPVDCGALMTCPH